MANPTLNRLIALGGTYNKSPVQRYYAARDARQRTDMNKLAMKSQEQKNQAFPAANKLANAQTRQSMGINENKDKIERFEAFGKSIAPILAPIVEEKDPAKQEAMYQKAIPTLKQAATGFRIPIEMPSQFDADRAKTIVQHYAPEQYEEVRRGGVPVAQRNTKTNKLVSHPEAPKREEVGAPGEFFGDKDLAKLTEKRRINEQTLYKSVHAINRLEKLVANENFVGGIAGDAVSMVNSLSSQAEQLMGLDSIVDESGNIRESEIDPNSKQLGRLKKMAMQNDAYSSAIIELAYVKAKLVDPASKITDKDFDFARKMLASGANKESIINTLRMQSKHSIENYNQEEKTAKTRFERYTPKPYSESEYRYRYNVSPPMKLDESSTPDDFAKDWIMNH